MSKMNVLFIVVTGLLWFARVLVSAQLALLNLLLMIVSTGYGINRSDNPYTKYRHLNYKHDRYLDSLPTMKY